MTITEVRTTFAATYDEWDRIARRGNSAASRRLWAKLGIIPKGQSTPRDTVFTFAFRDDSMEAAQQRIDRYTAALEAAE